MKQIFWSLILMAALTACAGENAKQTEEPKKEEEKVLTDTPLSEETQTTTEVPTETPTGVAEQPKKAANSNPAKPTTNHSTTTTPSNTKNTEPSPTPTPEPSVKRPQPQPAPNNPETTKTTKPNPQQLSHDEWDRLMRTYVSSTGAVNYSGLKKERNKVDAYLYQLGIHPPQSSWSRNEEMAYWINMYNAFTISLILEKYPNINSITEMESGKVWQNRTTLVVGTPYTLDQIEKEMLLKKFKEPRIHFAVNCAAKSCPPLLNAAWTKDNIQQNLEVQAKKFINNADYNSITAKNIQLSKIFEWYSADFGNLIDFLNKYSTTKIDVKAKIKYKEYDWGLNK